MMVDDALELDQVTLEPLSTLPPASLSVANSCCVCPVTSEDDCGLTATDATDALATVMRTVPDFPADVAVIVAEPEATPETRPADETLATDGFELDQVAMRPVSTLPLASLIVALSCRDCPIVTVADCVVNATDATVASVTVTSDVPVLPSEVAVIVAEPGALPVTSPVAETVTVD